MDVLWAEKSKRAYERYSFLISIRLAVKFKFINNVKYRGLTNKFKSYIRSRMTVN